MSQARDSDEGPVRKEIAIQGQRPEFRSLNPHTKPGASNPIAGEAETGRALGYTGSQSARSMRDPVSKHIGEKQ